MATQKAVLTCALTGVLTDPDVHHVPVTPEQMAREARRARDAGAAVVHVHCRDQTPGLGRLPSWDPAVAEAICQAIRAEVPDLLVNLSTGIVGPDISGPVACLTRVRPELAALNAGSLNYLKLRATNDWAWPPLLFDNPVEKVEAFERVMRAQQIVPECECFDTGIVRSVGLFARKGLVPDPPHLSLVMGVESGMPAQARWLPLLLEEMRPGTHWQVIGIGRQEVWALHRACAELGGDLRTGLEDTFYLPDGRKADGNGPLVEALARVAIEAGRSVASPAEARVLLGVRGAGAQSN
jgi:3-keto-5-aminohexanoate cleavage enzyme